MEDEQKSVVISKPESRRRNSQIGIDDFGELVRTDTNQSHSFFYDIVFGPWYVKIVIITESKLQLSP